VDKGQKKDIQYPRIYTIHSQKGGIGKTSIAIAIAGFAAIFHNKNALIIDADLTGTSLLDVLESPSKEQPPYFNELILAKPDQFAKFTPITSGELKKKSHTNMSHFYQKEPNYNKICYMPSSPHFDDILKIIPLISQEDYLHFFRHRLEDIIVTATMDQFEVIIIDHPPGLFGISTASLNMVLDQFAWDLTNEKDRPALTRLEKLYRVVSNKSIDKSIVAHAYLITTPDPSDYRALLPSFSLLLKRNRKIEVFKNQDAKIDLILNKAMETSKARFDPAMALNEIFKNVANFQDDRKVEPALIESLRARAKEVGALACGYVPNFAMASILPTIQSLKHKRDKEKEYLGMEGWCIQVGKSAGLYQD